MIKIDNLVKTFGTKRAVDGISFSVERGEVLGFLGPNGAGKSTTMRMITGFMPPTEGRVSVGGHDVAESPLEAKRLIGYLPENAAAYSDMTVEGFLNFAAQLRGLSASERRKGLTRVVERCFLESVLHQSIDTLSKGYRHRTCLAQALIHDPEVLIMDEPTDGLDPNQKHEVRKLIAEMGEEKAIIISTHILEEVEAVCTRAVVIARGRVVADARPDELKRRSRYHNAVRLTLNANVAPRVEQLLRELPGVQATEIVGKVNGVATLIVLPRAGAEIVRPVDEVVQRERIVVDEFAVEQGRLDDVFRELTLKAH
jgi:ABC-2 type transport system ATP-binding protein